MADDFDWVPFEGDRMSFDNIGDTITGIITDITVEAGRTSKYPLLTLQIDKAGNTREVAASPIDLKRQLALIAPQRGTMIRITMTGERNTGQPSPMKLFEVQTKESDLPAAPAPPPEPDPLDEFSDEEF